MPDETSLGATCTAAFSFIFLTPRYITYDVEATPCPASLRILVFDLYGRAPLTGDLGRIHVSHRFMAVPIVFRQCAPPRAVVGCASQLGLMYSNATPHHFMQLSHTTLHTHRHLQFAHTLHLHSSVYTYTHYFLFGCHHISFCPRWTINKHYNMAPQEAPYRPVL